MARLRRTPYREERQKVARRPDERQSGPDRLEPTIYRFVLRHSRREQILLVVLTLLSFPVLYYSLELPKVIVNQAIGGKHFPRDIFFGLKLGQIPYLLLLCGAFLALVVTNGLFK